MSEESLSTLVGCGIPVLIFVATVVQIYFMNKQSKAKKDAAKAASAAGRAARSVAVKAAEEKAKAETQRLSELYPAFKEIPPGVPVVRYDIGQSPFDFRDLLQMGFTRTELKFFTNEEIMGVVDIKHSIYDVRKKYHEQNSVKKDE